MFVLEVAFLDGVQLPAGKDFGRSPARVRAAVFWLAVCLQSAAHVVDNFCSDRPSDALADRCVSSPD